MSLENLEKFRMSEQDRETASQGQKGWKGVLRRRAGSLKHPQGGTSPPGSFRDAEEKWLSTSNL